MVALVELIKEPPRRCVSPDTVGYCRGLIPGDGVFGRREQRLDCPFADLGPAQQRLYGLTSYVAPAREVLCESGVGASRQPGVGNRERRDLVQAIDEFTDRCVPQRWRSGPTSRIQPTRSAVRRLPGGVRR